LIRTIDLHRIYRHGGEEVRALDGVSLEVREGEYLRVVGASGSGKSTLLNLIAGLDRATSGRIETPIGELSSLPPRDLALWRSRYVGMVFQSFNLIPHRTALQNVEIALLFGGEPRENRRHRAISQLERLGLGDRLHHPPADLSGGEQQRVALARALVKEPRLLLADEPTGNLDQENALLIARTFAELNRAGMTVVLVTHDAALADGVAHRTIRMNFGRVVSETAGPSGATIPRIAPAPPDADPVPRSAR
jgi:putative ABC transport system ATP-binding protein